MRFNIGLYTKGEISTKKELKPLVHNIKIKGNDKFSVVENINPSAIDIVVNDISKLLSKKK